MLHVDCLGSLARPWYRYALLHAHPLPPSLPPSRAQSGSGGVQFGGDKWAQLFAIQWVHAVCWIFGNMALALVVGTRHEE